MRTPQAVRISALVAYAIAFAAGLLVSYVIHLIFGSVGRGGFVDLNFLGILEIFGFVLVFSNVLLFNRQYFKLPVSTLLSAGLYAPPAARYFAAKLKTADSFASLEFEHDMAVVSERGQLVGIFDPASDQTLEWSHVPKAPGDVAITEVRGLLSKHPFVIIADGNQIHGVITPEMFIAGFWRGADSSKS